MGLSDAPAHVWSTIGFGVYISALVLISVVGLMTGNPGALWVWAILLLGGWDSDCECADCTGRVPEEEKASANDILARKYANGELSDEELDKQLGRVEQIQQADTEDAERVLETN